MKPVLVVKLPRPATWLLPVNDAEPALPPSTVAASVPVSVMSVPAIVVTEPPLTLPGIAIVEAAVNATEVGPVTLPAMFRLSPVSETTGADTLPPEATTSANPASLRTTE